MDRNDLIACFNDTFEISNSERLRAFTEKAKQSNRVYFENFVSNKHKNRFDADIIVESNTSFSAAKKYLEFGKTAVLNFANPEVAGGGVTNGAMAQEECLCRSSNLYVCLDERNVFNDYYIYHRLGNRFYSDRLIYTKNVIVFKNDDEIPQIMPENEWFNVDVITCAAPYLVQERYVNQAVLKEVFKSRIKNIFESAIDNDIEVLILGAFGCGAFKNPPTLVAEAFNEVIMENNYKQCFKKIVFAIKSTDERHINLNAFSSELSHYMDMCCVLSDINERFHKIPLLQNIDFSENKSFYEWQLKNEYFGKQFSILGDSISTLEGYNPDGHNVFYSLENCIKSKVNDMKDTWWGKVIDFFGGELLVNDSWSGSRVTKLPNQDDLFPSGCSEKRTGNLHIGSVKPEVIIVYLGTNDWANSCCLGNETRAVDFAVEEYFETAYSKMLNSLKTNYSNAEIWCCTLCETYMSVNASFKFPHKFAGNHIEAYNDSIRKIAKDYNCKLIDLYNYHIPYDTIDGTHPNENGMNTIATLVLRDMADEQGKSLLNCEKEQHDFAVVEQYTGGTRYICRKCGLERHTNTLGETFCDCCHIPISPTEEVCRFCGTTIQKNFLNNRIQGPTPNGGVYADIFYFDENGKSCSKDLAIKGVAQEFDSNGKMIHETFFVKKDDKNNNDKVAKSDFKWFEDAEYEEPRKGITIILFGDTISLFDEKEKKEIKIQKNKIDVGRMKELEIPIDNKAVSRRHASFLYEGSQWYLIDHNSTNGTTINGQRIEPNKKYLLYQNDVIDFANHKQYVFFKSITNEDKNSNLDKSETAVAVLENALVASRESGFNDINATKLIAISMCQAPLFFPMEVDIDAMFGDTDVKSLKAGDIITSSKEVRMKVLTLNLEGDEIIPLFTSEEQVEKGPSVSVCRFYPQDYLPMLLKEKKPIILNPFDENHVSFNYKFISEIVYPIFTGDGIENKVEKIDVGSVIDGRYELVAMVGRGGSSRVYLAKDVRLNDIYAVKVYDKNEKYADVLVAITLQEINLMKDLDHPAIPKVYDFVDLPNYFCVVQEYIKGETLQKALDTFGSQPEELVVNWAKQLCDVLGYLHTRTPAIIYRDVKPRNIMLKPDGTISLIDFGVARTYKPGQLADTTNLGTVGYAAPEQFGGKGQTDARTDIFGLGKTMHNLLTDSNLTEPPYETKPIRQYNPALSQQLESIIIKCIAPDPRDRYQSCEDLLQDLIKCNQKQEKKSLFSKLFDKK